MKARKMMMTGLLDGEVCPVASYDADLITNGSFENDGAGGADIFAWWAETAGDGTLEKSSAQAHTGTYSVKITAGPGLSTRVTSPNVPVTAGETYQLTFWAYGNGANNSRFAVYDVTNSAYIVGISPTYITGEAWEQYAVDIVAPAGCENVWLFFYAPGLNTAYCYYDDITFKRRVLTPGFFWDKFNRDDGRTVISPSGFSYFLQNTNSLGNLVINDGVLDCPTGTTGYGYVYVDLPSAPIELNAKFMFKSDQSGRSGSVVLVASKTATKAYDDLVHFLIYDEAWSLDVGDAGSFTNVGSGVLSLQPDITYYVSMKLSGSTAVLTIPTVGAVTLEHASIGALNGKYVYFELTHTDAGYKTPTIKRVEARY